MEKRNETVPIILVLNNKNTSVLVHLKKIFIAVIDVYI